MSAALGGGRPLLDVPMLNYFGDEGGYSASDSTPRLGLPPAAVYAAVPEPAALFQSSQGRVNYALSSGGATATAHNYTADGVFQGLYFRPSYANDGVRYATTQGDHYWRDHHPLPTWIEVNLGGVRGIDEVDIFTLPDHPAYTVQSDPSATQTFTQYGVTSFDVKYWTGSDWATVQGESVSGNNLVWRKLNFPAVTTDKIRIAVNAAADGVARITEVEAWGSSLAGGNGLIGEYYNGDSFNTHRLTRADASVNFDWGGGSPAASVDADFFTARWTGTVVPRYSETYTFYTTTDDGVRLWIDGTNVIDKWVDQAPTEWSGTVTLQAGRHYDLKMEFYEHWGGATVQLRWSSSSQAKEVIPQSQLYSPVGGGGAGYNFSAARLDPNNRTGGGGADPFSRNFNFQIPILSLPGRAGLDLGLTLSYNSLVWTKDTGGVTFDADEGFPGPGFRLGFPTIQPKFFNPQTQKYAYPLVTPSGSRVELRQTETPGVYESADSSYLQLLEGNGALTLLSTDGTRLSFYLLGGSYRCHEVRDRNGNYVSAVYHADGRLDRVVDTLGRTITFNYDSYQHLLSITQPWRRETEAQPNTAQDEQHTWATFGYGDPLTLQPSFSNLAVIGDQPGAAIPVLRQVGLDDGSYYKFEYNGWGQVWKA